MSDRKESGSEQQYRAYAVEVALTLEQLGSQRRIMDDFCITRDPHSRLGSGRRSPIGRHLVSWLFVDPIAARQFADAFNGMWLPFDYPPGSATASRKPPLVLRYLLAIVQEK